MLYLHIPFCKQACHYCDFHFSTSTRHIDAVVSAICEEIHLRANYLESNILESVYFGGGTPSLLAEKHFQQIWEAIFQYFKLDKNAEITLEANPDDLSEANLAVFKKYHINRLSIGVQSFNAEHLEWMNRAHTSNEANESILLAQQAGFDKISLDLIYGIPAPSHAILYNDLAQITSYNVHHISAYCLTIEPKTAFGKWLKAGTLAPVTDFFALEQLDITFDFLQKERYQNYEISNFCRDENYSKHNTAYWFQKPYLGIGPSAHSFNGTSRQFNIANNTKYLQGIIQGITPAQTETLSTNDQVNEMLMTQLRTKWGVNIAQLDTLSEGVFSKENVTMLNSFEKDGYLSINAQQLFLTKKGIQQADFISSELFLV
jgi:oxygen-independent coproporphyrinogen III oxidase